MPERATSGVRIAATTAKIQNSNRFSRVIAIVLVRNPFVWREYYGCGPDRAVRTFAEAQLRLRDPAMSVKQHPPRTVTQPAPAKVNLNLFVGPALAAGQPKARYHPVDSLMACVGLADEVRVTRRDGPNAEASGATTLSVRWAAEAPRASLIDWPMEKDLAVKAVRRLEQHVGRPLPAELEIIKRIPVGGGLGGGSSDAAATLVAVDRAFGLGLSTTQLMNIAAEIGSDVAFFVLCAREGITRGKVSGLGELVVPSKSSADLGRVVLVLPPFGCSTADVYREFDRGDLVRQRELFALQSEPRLNMLAAAAMRVEPRLEVLISVVRAGANGLACWITGSGSTICVELDRAQGSGLPEIESAIKHAPLGAEVAWMAEVVCVEVALR